jgi:hypothetical protein
MSRRLLPLVTLAAALLAASAVSATQPADDALLARVGQSGPRTFYLVAASRTLVGDTGSVWVFDAEHTPQAVNDDLIIGAWMLQTFNCKDRSGRVTEYAGINDHYGVAFSGPVDKPLPAPDPGTPLVTVTDFACTGAAPLGETFKGVRAAVEAAKR